MSRILGVAVIGVALFVVGALAASCGSDRPQPTPTPTKTPRAETKSPTPTADVASRLAIVMPSPAPTATKVPANTPVPSPTNPSEPVVAVVTTNSIVTPPTLTPSTTLPTATETAKPTITYPVIDVPFGYGVRLQFDTAEEMAFAVDKTHDLKFQWVHFDVEWRDIEPNAGQYTWTILDDAVEALNTLGINILVTVRDAPDWARNDDSDFAVIGPPADANTMADFVVKLVKRYLGKVQAVELWSGQNVWHNWGGEPLDVGRYVDLLCRSYRAIKAADQNMIVVAGALTPTGVNDGRIAIDDVVYLQRMYAAGAKNCFNALGAHPSGYNNPPDAKMGYTNPAEPSFKNHPSYFFRETMERYRAVMVANGDSGKRIWPTEFGWASDADPSPGLEYARDNSRQEQAEYIVEAFRLGSSWEWVGPMFVLVLSAQATQAENDLRGFSLWLVDGPTLAYQRLQALKPR